jgi:hypothetical protein
MDAVDVRQLGAHLRLADMVEDWSKSVRGLALQMLESGVTVPGYKLVAKRATRSWVDEAVALGALKALGAEESELVELRSPAQVEKALKARKLKLPGESHGLDQFRSHDGG